MWDRLTGVAGLILLIALFLPFYDSNEDTYSAWASFALIDKLILLTALLAIALPVAAALKPTPAGPQKLALATICLGLLALLGTVVRLFDYAEFDAVAAPVTLKAGAFLAVAGLLALLAACVLAMRERRAGRLSPGRVATT